MKQLLIVLAFAPVFLNAQSKKQRRALAEQQKADQAVLNHLRNHIQFLSGNKLEGHSTGSKGEALAMEYISNQFKAVGLKPKGTDGYIQQFVLEDGKQIDGSTFLSLNGKRLDLRQDYIPLAYSASKAVAGMPAMALRERGVPWFIDAKEWLTANASNPNFNIHDAIKKEATRAASRGATALFVYNSTNIADNIRFDNKDTAAPSSIPVLYILNQGYKKYFADHSQLLDIELNVGVSEKNRNGHNIVGYLDNNAARTIVIGAHYDHLGIGEDGNSRDSGKVVRSGADDNASGTALLIELARMLSASKAKSNNYIFIAFSGQEIGQAGSKFWLDNPTISTPINYMINLDIVGGYDASKKLSIAGYATSAAWPQLFTTITDKTLSVKFDSTVSGSGDHASFYRKDIPVLSFYTGSHDDYYRGTDKPDKINYEGELRIGKYIARLIEATDTRGKIAFAKAPEPVTTPVKNTVSLGIIPDSKYAAGGLKISGVSPQKTAAKLGLAAGDILVQLGSHRINDMNSYMEALSSFRAGDKTTLKIKRGKEDKEIAVEF